MEKIKLERSFKPFGLKVKEYSLPDNQESFEVYFLY